MTYTIEFDPSGIRLLCEEPVTISDAARRAGISLRSECGGKGTCGKCQVRVQSNTLPPVTEAEQELLTTSQIADNWRLACRTAISRNASVYVPTPSTIEGPVTQLDGLAVSIEPHPALRMLLLEVPPPSLVDQQSDLQRIACVLKRSHGIEKVWASPMVLRTLPGALRDGDWKVATALRANEIIAAYPGTIHRPVGLAADVGTTKLACYLVELETGRVIAAKGTINPQLYYGEDVISRLKAAMDDPASASKIQQMVVEAINAVSSELCTAQGLAPEHLLDICLVGNTAMHHLLLGLPVRALAVSPFVPATTSSLEFYAVLLGLHTAPGAYAFLPAPIAGFVGSDHLAVLLAAGFGEDNRTRLAIDIGTNTEIALQAGGHIVSCSTASGPAFEGAHISQGMRAAPGAIQRVNIKADCTVRCDVIGGGSALGICGSGILDAIAEMRATGIINERGRLVRGRPGVRLRDDGMPVFLLVQSDQDECGVAITQKDIDQVLLAKGAIRTGMEILMSHLEVSAHDIDEVSLAGAFGTYLDPHNAIRIGLLPQIPLNRIHAIGNAAGAGARMMLASVDSRRKAISLARQVDYLELTVYPEFSKFFVAGIRLPSE